MSEIKSIKLVGRALITFDIEAMTGLHIGGSDAGVEIGGVDKTIIRDKLTNRPYIPGSSLKGKMRSLLEKYNGLPQNKKIGQGYIHTCDEPGDYKTCKVCQVFGVPGEKGFSTPTRLTVRDAFLSEKSAEDLADKTDLPFTEVKTEVSIDRVTSAANPRQMERAPAGTVFGGFKMSKDKKEIPQPAEMVYTVYEITENGQVIHKAETDVERLTVLLEGMKLIEDDYLGGLGSRGSGKVAFRNICLKWRKDPAEEAKTIGRESYPTLAEFAADFENVKNAIKL